MDSRPLPHTRPRAQKTSDLLGELIGVFPNERVSVGELVDKLGNRAHGVLLLVLALPMCIPNIPGISTIFGILMIAPSVQMIFGAKQLWLPKSVRAWSFPRSSLESTLNRAIPMLKRVEYLIRARWTWLTQWPATSAVGVQCLIMALILILPLWGANFTPGVTVTMTSLALLQKDGLLMLLSVPAALGSMAWVYFGAKFSWAALQWMIDGVHWLARAVGIG